MDKPKHVREAIERLGWLPDQNSDVFIRDSLHALHLMQEWEKEFVAWRREFWGFAAAGRLPALLSMPPLPPKERTNV